MVIAETLVVDGDPDLLEEHLDFQRSAGVGRFLVAAPPDAGVRARLEGQEDVVFVTGLDGGAAAARTRMAERALEEGADWVLHAEPQEFWWPRGESLADVLAPIPPRYTVVQGLRRELVADAAGMPPTRRRPVRAAAGALALRPIHRPAPGVQVGEDGGIAMPNWVPLRAWYPIEVMAVVAGGGDDDDDLIVDTRLRDALAGSLRFRVPDVVDDATYAVECAAVGEVDLPRLEAYIEELEQRVAWLEQRLWPRLMRRVGRVVRRG